jgi:hypothetical protein
VAHKAWLMKDEDVPVHGTLEGMDIPGTRLYTVCLHTSCQQRPCCSDSSWMFLGLGEGCDQHMCCYTITVSLPPFLSSCVSAFLFRLGVWDVTSTLVAVDLPMGADMLPAPNKAAVRRAEQEDLNKPLTYQVGPSA